MREDGVQEPRLAPALAGASEALADVGGSKSDEVPPTAEGAAAAPKTAILKSVLEDLYVEALALVENDSVDELVARLGELGVVVDRLCEIKHAGRGALLTLTLYKTCAPAQDIRYNKTEHEGGFSARAVDSAVTVPLLLRESLPRNVETHWLSQTLSFAAPWVRSLEFKMVPKEVGPLLLDAVNLLEETPEGKQVETARDMTLLILSRLIGVRNRSRVDITRPKGLAIDEVRSLMSQLMATKYKTGAPRLPQLIIYALYGALIRSGIGRYEGAELLPLGRMKAADRKSGTVGDVVVARSARPMEAVETKFDIPISLGIVAEAMDKVKSLSVDRYLILSTGGVVSSDADEIRKSVGVFKRSNGCEVIVNGILETMSYYLRLLPSTNDYIEEFAQLLETDDDLDYEHRVAWNALCAER